MSLLAVLELMRLGRIRAQQTELFGEIVIERASRASPGAAAERDCGVDHDGRP